MFWELIFVVINIFENFYSYFTFNSAISFCYIQIKLNLMYIIPKILRKGWPNFCKIMSFILLFFFF